MRIAGLTYRTCIKYHSLILNFCVRNIFLSCAFAKNFICKCSVKFGVEITHPRRRSTAHFTTLKRTFNKLWSLDVYIERFFLFLKYSQGIKTRPEILIPSWHLARCSTIIRIAKWKLVIFVLRDCIRVNLLHPYYSVDIKKSRRMFFLRLLRILLKWSISFMAVCCASTNGL